MLAEQQKQIIEWIEAALAPLLDGTGVAAQVVLERPKVAAHGDMACNVAMQIAKPLRRNPRDIAAAIVAHLKSDRAAQSMIADAEIAGPGFVNLRLTSVAKRAVIPAVLRERERFGHTAPLTRDKTLVEFVSANPTGPLHVGHGRQAALGDAIVQLLRSQGYAVTSEFYYNDGGVQIANLTLSVRARIQGLEPGDAQWPEQGYNGEYVADIARDFMTKSTVTADDRTFTASADPGDIEGIRQFAVAYIRHEQDLDLRAFGVTFDNFYLESSLYGDGKVERTIEGLIQSGETYEKDGALWLRTTSYGDDEDRVMRKSSDGTLTYFVPDIAYHVEKWRRGFTKAITILGGDHAGSLARVHAGLQALHIGIPPGYPDYRLNKMVRVMRAGEEVKISKRAGGYVTLRDLIGWVGRDAVRFFLVSRKAGTEFTFDVDLALERSEENPVYYVQYAHARICSVLALALERQGDREDALYGADLSALGSEREGALMQRLAQFPTVLCDAADELAPHQVAFYLKDCAADLHSYYNAERILVDDATTRQARLALLLATRQVLRNGLALLGVSAPEKMYQEEGA
jgi:arginyl-tRNA synthetase